MMSNQMEERKILREIIPLLHCLHQTLKIYPNQSIDEAYQKINKVYYLSNILECIIQKAI